MPEAQVMRRNPGRRLLWKGITIRVVGSVHGSGSGQVVVRRTGLDATASNRAEEGSSMGIKGRSWKLVVAIAGWLVALSTTPGSRG
jgi:hypothetical protein